MSEKEENLLLPKLIGMFQTKQKVKSGIYVCTNCGEHSEQISKDGNKLPICKVCQDFTYWYKL